MDYYFKKQLKNQDFIENIKKIINRIENKKIIIYDRENRYKALSKIFNLKNKLEIIDVCIQQKDLEKTIKENYDYILVTSEDSMYDLFILEKTFNVSLDKVILIFNTELKEEAESINYLEEDNFSKRLPKLIKKLNNKKIILYGAGTFFEVINKHYNLENLDILGICDKRFENHKKNETFLNYKTYSIEEVKKIKPDYILVCTKVYIDIIEKLQFETFKDLNIKIRPLHKKSIKKLLKEIWR